MAGKKVSCKRKAGKRTGKKTVWKTVRVPEQLHKILKSKAKKQGIAMHKLISQLFLEANILPYKDVQQKLTGEAKNVDKAFWYAFKLNNSISMLKQAVILAGKIDSAECEQIKRFIDDELRKTMRTVEQIEKRCKVDLQELKQAVKHYVEGDGEVTTAGLNDRTKIAMIQIVNSVLGAQA